MERRDSQIWIKNLKIAVINKDLEKLEFYSKIEPPIFKDVEEAKKGLSLIKEAVKILKEEKDKIGRELQLFKQQKNYLQNSSYSTFSFQA